MGRLSAAFSSSRATGLVPYLTAGYPDSETTLECLRRVARAGARAIELGVPFSDPIADGPDIQRASEWAVRRGGGAREALAIAAAFRREDPHTPLVVMTYANPVLAVGVPRFAAEAAAAGVDGVLVSDLPPDESPETWAAFDAHGLDTVLLVAPHTPAERLDRILARCRGFVYVLARTGVTGGTAGEAGDLGARIAAVRARCALPVAVGFGIAKGDDARALRGRADAVVVGAAFTRAIAADPARGAADRVEALARELTGALG